MTSRPESPSCSPHHALLATVPALALFACGGDTTRTADAVVEDSAGVRIVQHTGPTDGEPHFAFAPEPIYRHGDGPGDYTFARIWRGTLLGDGSAAIFDAGSSEVVRLNPDGTFHSVLAPAGEGPGEVSQLVTSMFAFGRDSIVVLDRAQTRSTLFVNGALAHTASILDLRRATSLWPMGFDDAGRFLVATTSFLPGFEEEWLFGHMARYDPETGAVDTVASYKYVPGESNPAPGVGRVLVAGGQFVYVRTDIPEVVWHLADGTVRQISRWQLDPRYLTAEDLEAIEPILRDRLRFVNPGASDEEVASMTRQNMAQHEADLGNPIEHFKSPFADAEGRIWLPTSMPGIPGEGVPPYTVISPEGEWLGMVDAPPGLRILDVGRERVLGVMTDEMGVESVVVYELVDAN
ncbi:MAG: hypothetical protein F4139_11735 [Gemmatimonadetes bacterium]|nr:hypothetical protein [Gemmatimonadota bacterium]MYA64291.1 hypothetical protein [Gemmatimonadota bacterium]MYB99874.1 hypothetical protein [Gemmatimonadota bacterium]MYH53593.1 hypothetical protein [Gemmatimonadota bacterium]MYK67504.1 hypothetical protein [Gemmatimonadota bacterium]